ncbi:hypothetical protein GCM10017744_059910 [Streptomyces antimycoticus]|uniref:Uncharacterized protein n=1 Tax=Streptomyces antimycoticus TaxID=68175 RepID=A0A4D4K5E6_9ACTN|nr:hypothetical protein SANT12839_042260 [Streptomyces antimycoticus]
MRKRPGHHPSDPTPSRLVGGHPPVAQGARPFRVRPGSWVLGGGGYGPALPRRGGTDSGPVPDRPGVPVPGGGGYDPARPVSTETAPQWDKPLVRLRTAQERGWPTVPPPPQRLEGCSPEAGP